MDGIIDFICCNSKEIRPVGRSGESPFDVEVVVEGREREVALRGEGESDGRGMRLKNPPGHQGVIYANGRIWDCAAGSLPLLLLLLRPFPSPHPLRTEEKGANEGGREGKGSLRMKHDVDSCNFAMDIVMWEAHAKATRTRSLLEGGEERREESGK